MKINARIYGVKLLGYLKINFIKLKLFMEDIQLNDCHMEFVIFMYQVEG